jgi:hypothetical protein
MLGDELDFLLPLHESRLVSPLPEFDIGEVVQKQPQDGDSGPGRSPQ